MKKVFHVNQHVIRANRKGGKRKPVLTIKTSRSNTYGFEVEVHGPARIVLPPAQAPKLWRDGLGRNLRGSSHRPEKDTAVSNINFF
jgi:hypothetical protein